MVFKFYVFIICLNILFNNKCAIFGVFIIFFLLNSESVIKIGFSLQIELILVLQRYSLKMLIICLNCRSKCKIAVINSCTFSEWIAFFHSKSLYALIDRSLCVSFILDQVFALKYLFRLIFNHSQPGASLDILCLDLRLCLIVCLFYLLQIYLFNIFRLKVLDNLSIWSFLFIIHFQINLKLKLYQKFYN